ncbi:MAG: esterase-like activity of phytase family protein [Rhizobiaceae bacterium]
MSGRLRIAASAALLLLALPAAAKDLAVTAYRIENFRLGSAETRFGRLEFNGGLDLRSDDDDLGALSAIRFLSPGGRFMGVADTGFWYFGTIERDDAGRPNGISAFSMQEMVDRAGRVIGEKWQTDAEGLGVRDGVATASFERKHRVSEYRLDEAAMGGPVGEVPFLVPGHELRDNRGFETVAQSPADGPLAGARVIVSEKSLDRNGDVFGAVLEGPRKGVFSVARSGEFDITDGAFLPDGDLILLERAFSMAEGVRMRLRRIAGDTIAKGARIDGEILLEADLTAQIDNMEGLDAWQAPDGSTMLSLVSDDNHSLLQRTLYLEFRLVAD